MTFLAKLLDLHNVIIGGQVEVHPGHGEGDVGQGGDGRAVDHILAAHDGCPAQQLVDLRDGVRGSRNQRGARVGDGLRERFYLGFYSFKKGRMEIT